jgi:hypothetical protein
MVLYFAFVVHLSGIVLSPPLLTGDRNHWSWQCKLVWDRIEEHAKDPKRNSLLKHVFQMLTERRHFVNNFIEEFIHIMNSLPKK